MNTISCMCSSGPPFSCSCLTVTHKQWQFGIFYSKQMNGTFICYLKKYNSDRYLYNFTLSKICAEYFYFTQVCKVLFTFAYDTFNNAANTNIKTRWLIPVFSSIIFQLYVNSTYNFFITSKSTRFSWHVITERPQFMIHLKLPKGHMTTLKTLEEQSTNHAQLHIE